MNFVIKVSKKGFARLSYYSEEDIISEYEILDNKTSVDIWINDILAEICRKDWVSDSQNILQICIDIFFALYPYEANEPPSNFFIAIDSIVDNKLIYWEQKSP